MKNRIGKVKRKGVSDVIATLLILAITVTLFSTIFVWVQTLPPPTGKRYVEITGESGVGEVSPGQYRYYVNLTHKGGEALSKNMVTIVISLPDITPTPPTFVRTISDSLVPLGDFWDSGETWRWNTTGTYTKPDSNVTVTVIDTVKNQILWQGSIPGPDINAPPQILERGTDPEIVETGKTFIVWAIVKDRDLNFDSVYVDLRKLDNTTFTQPIKMNYTSGWKFMTDNLTLSSGVMPGKYACIINATDNKSHQSMGQIVITVATGEGLPELIVDRIILSNQSPTRGDNVSITAVIKNMKARAAQSSNITFRDYINVSGVWTERWNYTVTNFSVSGYGQSLAFTYWIAEPGGVHRIVVNITDVMPGNRTGVGGNVTVVVTPKILLVDDDGALTGSSTDVVSYMSAALLATNLRYDLAVVSGGADGPGYNTGDKKLKDYDVVIWMGGSTNNTLTANDQSNLGTFLDNGGNLWLIGQNILEGVPSWFTNKIGAGIYQTVAMPPALTGTNPGATWIDTSGFNPQMRANSPFTIAKQLTPAGTARAVFYDNTGGRTLATQYRNIIGSKEYRVVVFGFEFGMMNNTGDQAVTVYKVINWLGGIDMRTGKDVAVAGQTISPTKPRYNQPVNISAVIRNNGNVDLTNVRTRLYINDQPKTLLDNVTDLQGNGSWKVVKFQWVPDRVGSYVIKVMVDPDNEIEETNEANNVYVSDVGVYTVEVIYTVLFVDDDSSPENGGGGTLPDVSAHVLRALSMLGYQNGTNMDIQKVPRGQDRDNNVYNASNYSCIIWVTGLASAGGGYNTLTNNDINVIQSYLSAGQDQVSFLLIGRSVLSDAVVQSRPDFYQNILGASTTGSSQQIAGTYGVRENPVTNGAYISFDNTSASPYWVRTYTKIATAIPLFWTYATNYWYRTSDEVVGTAINSSAGWHSAYLAFDLAYTTNINTIADFLYGIIHWFGRIDNVPELRVTPPDLFAGTNTRQYIILPELNPQLGESYVLKANITNWGGSDADIVVRFLDGDTVIGSQNVHVPASYRDAYGQVQNGKVTAEVIWTPLFAGIEPIRASVDPDNLLVGIEVLRTNNLAEQRIQVYFFYDDMEIPERTDANWNHDATKLNINGESALDFIPRPDLNTNVLRDWEWNLSGCTDYSGVTTYGGNGTYHTDWANVTNYTRYSAHTPPKAYWLPETPRMETGQKKPIDLILLIDVSGSMNWDDIPVGDPYDGWPRSRISDAKDAAKAAVSMLGVDDRIAIVTFSNDVSIPPYIPFRYTNTSADRAAINSTIDGISAGGGTSLFDGASYAVEYMNSNGRGGAVKGIIFLTDGVSNSDNDYRPYAPGTGNGYEPSEPGPINYYTAGNGLCSLPYNVFTVSIGPTPDARMHAISLTGAANISYGVVCSDPTKLGDLFKMFVEKLLMESTGGITVPEFAPDFESNAILNPVTRGVSLSNMPFVVFADGFRSKNWSAPTLTSSGTWVAWSNSGWAYNDNDLLYDGYRTSVYAGASGSTLSARIDPAPVLAKLANTGSVYTIKSVNVSFLAYGSIAVDVSTDGSTWSTAGSGSYTSHTTTMYGSYVQYSITNYINPGAPFYVRFRSTSWLYLDDVIVLYVLDTTQSSGGGGADPAYNTTIKPAEYRFLTTPPVSIDTTNVTAAVVSFYTRYSMTAGTNGGFLYLWGSNDGTTWVWDMYHRIYLMPKQPYNGNLRLDAVANESTTGGLTGNGLVDMYGNLPYWCFNGKSAGGTYTWEKIEVDLTPYLSSWRAIRIRFVFAQMGGVLPPRWTSDMGWYIDDVQIKVKGGAPDYWHVVANSAQAHSGSRYWYYCSPSTYLPLGVDVSLYTRPIDLTRAYKATLILFFRFNINDGTGLPPDGVRVEVSRDNGETWESLTYGVRIGWGYTGRDTTTIENRSYYSITGDGPGGELPQRYSGVRGTLYKENWTFVRASNADSGVYGWIPSFTLVRLNCDLSGFAGNTVILRIRVFTNNTGSESSPVHYASAAYDRGTFVDDVFVIGTSLIHPIAETQSTTKQR